MYKWFAFLLFVHFASCDIPWSKANGAHTVGEENSWPFGAAALAACSQDPKAPADALAPRRRASEGEGVSEWVTARRRII